MHLGGGLADHYIRIDFVGRRYFSLIEPESSALGDYEWPHTHSLSDMLSNPLRISDRLYGMYHIWADYARIEMLTVGINNVAAGKSVRVGMERIKGLPLVQGKLINPSVQLRDRRLTFPVELESGSYLEFLAMDACTVYDRNGECLGKVMPQGKVPDVAAGANELSVECRTLNGAHGCANLTLIMYGEPLQPRDTP